MPECYIRGSTIKYLRIPDEVIDMVKEDAQMKSRQRIDMKGNRGNNPNQRQQNRQGGGGGGGPGGNKGNFGGGGGNNGPRGGVGRNQLQGRPGIGSGAATINKNPQMNKKK